MALDPVDTTSTIVASATLRFPPNPRATASLHTSTPAAAHKPVDVSDFGSTPSKPSLPTVTASAPSALTVSTPLTSADRSAKYHSVHLPSNFYFYPFTQLSVSLITGLQQAKFTRAAKEQNLRYAVEAVSSTLGDSVNAMDLTVPDFFYVMYWLRLASYTKTDFTYRSFCQDHDHHARVKSGELPASTLSTIHVLRHTNIEETQLDARAVSLAADALAEAGFSYAISPSTMRDAVAYADILPDMPYDPQDRRATQEYEARVSELEFIGNLACHISAQQIVDNSPVTLSFEDRCRLVETLSADHVQLLKTYMVAVGSYGIKETIQAKCKECGADSETEISVSASDFF